MIISSYQICLLNILLIRHFLVNFWSTMMTMGLAMCILIFCLGCRKFFLKRRKLGGGWFRSLVQKVISGSVNFIVVQAYGSLDNILFYFVLDVKTNPWKSAFSRASLAFGILLIICGSLLIIFSIRVVQRYHTLKCEGLAKKDMKELENYQKNKHLEVFYGDFSDADLWSHCFMVLLVLRSNISSLIFTILYEYPLMQTMIFVVLDGVILLFMLIEKPLRTPRGVFFQFCFETIVLIVHICTLLLSWNDEPSEGLKKNMSTTIIYLNTALGTVYAFSFIPDVVCFTSRTCCAVTSFTVSDGTAPSFNVDVEVLVTFTFCFSRISCGRTGTNTNILIKEIVCITNCTLGTIMDKCIR